MLEALNIKNGDDIPEFGANEGPCDAEIAACCFLRSYFTLACHFSLLALSRAAFLPPRAMANTTVGTSVHQGNTSRHAMYTTRRRHYIRAMERAANVHLQVAHLLVGASPTFIKTTDEVLVHATTSLGSHEQGHWVGINPQWSEVWSVLARCN